MVRALIRKVLSKLTGSSKKEKPAHRPEFHGASSASPAKHPPKRETERGHGQGRRPSQGDSGHSGRGEGRGRRRGGPRDDQRGERSSSPQAQPQQEQPPVPFEPWDPASFVVPVVEGKTRFQDLGLPEELVHAIADLKFQYCTPIQSMILPETLKGKDAYGRAQTGTGKTAAFLITLFTRLMQKPVEGERRRGTPRALILAPTRELCIQIQKDAMGLGKYLPLRTVAIYGGMDYEKQKRMLTDALVDIVVATPGRLIDFKNQHAIHLGHVEMLVIDEADRMLDMGFIPDVRSIVHSTPHKGQRQTLFFTATMTDDVMRLGNQWTVDPVKMEVAPENVAVDTVDQVTYIVRIQDKFALLFNILQRDNAQKVIVFANRRDVSERLCDQLRRYQIDCALLSGAVAQEKRIKVLEAFKTGRIRVLVATDVAGRGIHVDGVSHVVNFNLPIDPEDYVHRIGRTGRAGNTGTSISFADEDDGMLLPDIEKYIGRELKCTHPDDEWLVLPPPPPGSVEPSLHASDRAPQHDRPGAGRGGGRGGGGGRGRPRRR